MSTVVVDSLNNVPQFIWDLEAGTVEDRTVDPPVTRPITEAEMVRFAEPAAEPEAPLQVDPVVLEEIFTTVQSATTVPQLQSALTDLINAIKPAQ